MAKNGLPVSLFVDQFRQRASMSRFAMKGIRNQLLQVFTRQRGEYDVLHRRSRLAHRV